MNGGKRGGVPNDIGPKRTKLAPYQDALAPFIAAHDVEDLDPLACDTLDNAAAQLFRANTLYGKPADTNLADWDVEYTAAAVKDSFRFIALTLESARQTLKSKFTDWSIELMSPTFKNADGEVSTPLRLKMEGCEMGKVTSMAVYCFVENKVIHGAEGWASAMNKANKSYDASNKMLMNVMQQKCSGYSKFCKSVKAWVNDFNSYSDPLVGEAELFATYKPVPFDNQIYSAFKEDFGAFVVDILFRAPDNDKDEAETVYKFVLNYFNHTVEDSLFFYKTSEEARKLSKQLIDDRFTSRPTIGPFQQNEGDRTLLGMLSTWNRCFSTLGLKDITWIPRKEWWTSFMPPRAIVLEDVWRSGRISSKRLSKAMQIYELLEKEGYNRNSKPLEDALKMLKMLKDEGHTDIQLTRATEVYDSLKRKAERHGREFNRDLRKIIKDNGYYGLMAAGGLRHVKIGEGAEGRNNPKALRGIEVTCAVCDACV